MRLLAPFDAVARISYQRQQRLTQFRHPEVRLEGRRPRRLGRILRGPLSRPPQDDGQYLGQTDLFHDADGYPPLTA